MFSRSRLRRRKRPGEARRFRSQKVDRPDTDGDAFFIPVIFTLMTISEFKQKISRLTPDTFRIKLGIFLSRCGELLKIDSLVYNRYIYYHFDRFAGLTAPVLGDILDRLEIRPKTVVDFGAGSGRYVAEFRRRGANAIGLEYSATARSFAKKRHTLELLPFDLGDKNLRAHPVDFAMSLEVAEHVPHELAMRLVQLCMDSAPIVLFSAARPGQPGQGHINCRPFSDWKLLFENGGFVLDEKATNTLRHDLSRDLVACRWLIENVGLYRKTSK